MSDYRASDQISQSIKGNLHLPPNEFQKFLYDLPLNYDVFFTIADLMNNLEKKEQKQAMATSFNFLVKRDFKKNDKCTDGWRVFQQQIATKKQARESDRKAQISDWKLSNITQKAFVAFVQSFEQQFTPVLQQIYFKLNLNHKILLQQMMPRGDINQVARQLFLQETCQEYIRIGLDQLSQINTLQEQQKLQELESRFLAYLKSLRETLIYLNYQSADNHQISHLTNKICSSQELYNLIRQCVYFDLQRDSREYKVSDNGTNNSDNSENSNSNGTKQRKFRPLFSHTGTFKKQQILNNVKAVSLQIFCVMLNRYSSKAGLAEFDQSRVLAMMESMAPDLIQQLSDTRTNKLCLECNEKLTISMLNAIKKSMNFLFMNDFYWKNYKRVFWRILYPLLNITDQQIRQFQDDPQDFIAQSETLIQKEQDDPEIVESGKTYAAFLLDFTITSIDGALTAISEGILALLSFALSGEKNIICKEIMEQFQVKQSLQACFTVLSILTSKIKKRQDLLQQLREIFNDNKRKLLNLKKIQKAYLLIYLNYNFAQLFRQSLPTQRPIAYSRSTEDYYHMVADSLEQGEILTKLSVTFFMDYHNLEPSTSIILTRIIELIESTKSIDILEAIPRILFECDGQIDYDIIKEALNKCLTRILKDNVSYMSAIERDQVYSNICMLKCLHIVGAIAFNYSRAPAQRQAEEIMAIVWRVFDLMENIVYANYGEELVKMFGVVMTFIKVIDIADFYQFLDVFGAYSAKHQQIGALFKIYLVLLMKGERYLKQTNEGQQFVQKIVDNCLTIVRFNFRNRSTIAIILLQYILINFPRVHLNHEQIYNSTQQLLHTVNNLKQQNITAIFNLWIIGSSISDAYDLGELDQLRPEAIFGYQAKIFAIAMEIKIKQLCSDTLNNPNHQDTITKILFLVKSCVEFVKFYEGKNKNRNGEISEKIEQFNISCPNQKIKSAFLTMKRSLSEQDYGFIMREVQCSIPIEELKKMLSQSGQQQRIVFKIRHN